MNPLTQSKNTTILLVLIALTLVCFALSPKARAVTRAPDGGYPNENTSEDDDALFSLKTGGDNTAMRFDALDSNTTNPLANWVWGTTGDLNIACGLHTATLLQNGMVLVAAGQNDYGDPFGFAELYDPASGTWIATGRMNTTHTLHTATLLPNGMVLVAGGFSRHRHEASSSAELYDPASGTWTATGSLNDGRYGHTAALLQNGNVLVAGGLIENSLVLSSAEL